MKLRINSRGVGNILLMALFVLFIMHLLVLLGIMKPDLIWDTTATDTESVIISEWIAIFFIFLFAFGVCLKLNYFPLRRLRRSADSILWIMVLYYALNIIGIFMSNSPLAKGIYAPLALFLIILVIRLIFSKSPEAKGKSLSHKSSHQKIRRAS